MNYKMLVLDIDGTLTNSKKEITKKTKGAVLRLADQGVHVVIASGRPVNGILPYAKELGLTKKGGYILAFNGAKIVGFHPTDGDEIHYHTLYEKNLPLHTVDRLGQLAKERGLAMLTYDRGYVISTNPRDPFVDLEARINKIPLRQIESFKEYGELLTPKCIVTGEGNLLAKEEEVFAKAFEELDVYRSEEFFLEVVPKGVNKAEAIESFLNVLRKEGEEIRKEEVVAIGDGYNDLSMISYAGMGVAMANAKDEVKEAADYVTDSNDQDGVAKAIEKIWP